MNFSPVDVQPPYHVVWNAFGTQVEYSQGISKYSQLNRLLAWRTSMPSIFMAIASVRDWKAIQALTDEGLLENVRRAGITGYRLHRNLEDASQMMLMIEAPYGDDIDDLIVWFNALFKEDVLASSAWETIVDRGAD